MRFKIIFFLISFLPCWAWGQYPAPKIEMGPQHISMHENLEVTVTIYGPSYELDEFPELGGFLKGSRTISHSEEVLEGKLVETHTIKKYYRPIQGGSFEIPSFDLEINDKIFKTPTYKVFVEDDEDDFSELSINIEDVALVVECSKNEIFVGEGVKVRVAFYLSGKNTENWQFRADVAKQIEAIAKKIKPENCLESRNFIDNIEARTEYLKGVKYEVYDVYESVFYPINNKNIQIPSVSLVMNKRNNQSAVLQTQAKSIRVKELPAHPLREKVAVGYFRLKESSTAKSIQTTGESFDYNLRVEGQSNFAAVNINSVVNNEFFDFYEAGIETHQQEGKLAGYKVFKYKILPKKAGSFALKDYLSLVYFDIRKGNYDTLSPQSKVVVTGKTIQSKEQTKQDIYSGIENLKTDENEFNFRAFFKVIANVILVFMVMFLIFLMKKK